MVDRSSMPKHPRDPKRRAKLTVDIATGEVKDDSPDRSKNPHAVALGRMGGLKGGRARAERLSPERRSEIARTAAQARWAAKKSEGER